MSDGTTDIKFATPATVREDAENKDGTAVPLDPDRFLIMAKRLVVGNYNEYHNAEMTPSLSTDDVYIVWFTMLLKSWKAVLSSTAVKGVMWMVTWNGQRSEGYIQVFKQINNVRVGKEHSHD